MYPNFPINMMTIALDNGPLASDDAPMKLPPAPFAFSLVFSSTSKDASQVPFSMLFFMSTSTHPDYVSYSIKPFLHDFLHELMQVDMYNTILASD